MKEIASGIRYIGVDDKDLDLFESQYVVPEGISYNSYLLVDEKVAILDTADHRMLEPWLAGLEEALEGRRPDYLVIHHMEPDHSGCIDALVDRYPELTLVASAKALQLLGQFVPERVFPNTLPVKEGDTLPLGRHTLRFVSAPMVHWPEVMVSYDAITGTLFSADAFGKFGALEGKLFSQADDWACEARRYYFNICGKYGRQVEMLLAKLRPLELRCIAPLHGPVLQEELPFYLNLYDLWSRYLPETDGVMVAYASIHGGTAQVACRAAEMLREKGVRVALCDLTRDDRAEAVEDAFRYGTLLLAACSYDAGLFTPAHDFLHSLQMKGWCKRRVGLIENGSWAPSAARVMKEMLSAMKDITLVGDTLTIRSRFRAADQPALEALVNALIQA